MSGEGRQPESNLSIRFTNVGIILQPIQAEGISFRLAQVLDAQEVSAPKVFEHESQMLGPYKLCSSLCVQFKSDKKFSEKELLCAVQAVLPNFANLSGAWQRSVNVMKAQKCRDLPGVTEQLPEHCQSCHGDNSTVYQVCLDSTGAHTF